MAELARAAFRKGPFTVTSGGSEYTALYRPASRWMEIFANRSWVLLVVQTLDTDSYERILQGIEDERLGPGDLVGIARAVITEAAGRPWWEAERLVAAGSGNDRILGRVMTGGTDLERVTLAAFCAVVWSVITHGAGPEDMLKLESQLTVPPPDVQPEDIREEQDLAAVAQRLRQLPGVRVG